VHGEAVEDVLALLFMAIRKLRTWNILVFEGAKRTGGYVLTEKAKAIIKRDK